MDRTAVTVEETTSGRVDLEHESPSGDRQMASDELAPRQTHEPSGGVDIIPSEIDVAWSAAAVPRSLALES